jgi:hypothetical protein
LFLRLAGRDCFEADGVARFGRLGFEDGALDLGGRGSLEFMRAAIG